MKTSLPRLALVLFFTLGVAPAMRAQSSPNGVDMFLKLDSVKGSSTDSAFKDQMVVLDFGYSITVTGGGVSGGAGKSNPGNLVITKPLDIATPILAQSAAAGTPYQQAVLTIRRPEKGEQKVVYTITLSDVRVYGVAQTGVTSGETAFPLTEKVSLFYSKAEWAVGSTKAGRDFGNNRNAIILGEIDPENGGAIQEGKTPQSAFLSSPVK